MSLFSLAKGRNVWFSCSSSKAPDYVMVEKKRTTLKSLL